MQQVQNYEIGGLLKAGIDKNLNPIYILIENLMTNEDQLSIKFDSYLKTNRPFKPFILIVCSQNETSLSEKLAKNVIKKATKLKVCNQQFQRIDKLIVISDENNIKRDNIIPYSLKSILKDKIIIVKNANQLNLFEIDLHQSILRFLCNKIEYQEELPFYGRQLTSYPISQNGLPVFLEEILNFYKRNEQFLHSAGVFRISGSHDQEMALVEQLKLQNYQQIDQFDPHVVSTVLKNALANLKEPIFPFQVFEILKETRVDISKEESVDMFKVFLSQIPYAHRVTVKKIAELIKQVASFQQDNLMNVHNLSVVFAPCFFRPKIGLLIDLQGSKIVVQHFERFIENIDQILEADKRISQDRGKNQVTTQI